MGNDGQIDRLFNFTTLHIYTNINVNSIPTCLDNLKRLGIIEILKDEYFSDDTRYDLLRNDSALDSLLQSIRDNNNTIKFRKGLIRLTSFGTDFVENVVAM